MAHISALTFDVFGTLLECEPGCAWFSIYAEKVAAINGGREPYRPLNVIFAEIGADWRGLRRRPGVVEALEKLRGKFCIAPLSNANSSPALMADISVEFNLPWNAEIDTSGVRAYKPAPEVYLAALRQLGLAGDGVIHVASHPYDLRAAKAAGMWTAYIHWPGYASPGVSDEFDFHADSLSDLANDLFGGQFR